jgi:hypothetical protein
MRVPLLLAFTACTSVAQIPLNTPARALTPRAPDSVEVYASSPPTRPHVDVAVLQVVDYWPRDDAAHRAAKLRARAASLGCDALVIGGAYLNQLFATCLVYTDVPALAAK